ncbi:hypothetical protein CFC21_044683 [Triticum aestivum]|uniref:Protein kinase domain-containing protein n=2 Tax=Triticum aestivum TaxID=4565 RepID=A0A9R1FRH4_WHEAT|nr:hypothetical protein CFC21_044683 [Triticum aestivum]
MELPSIATRRDLECILSDETAEPMALPLPLLQDITDDFSKEHEIGRGGFTVVYKGKLGNRNVAVQRFSSTHIIENMFQQELECLLKVKHKNVVRFLGYCVNTQGFLATYNGKMVMVDVPERLLCFEYLPKGSLDKYITDTSHKLQWTDCFRIITGICQGLNYLHQKNIVHLDLKPTNILLDDKFVPKITGFTLSRCAVESEDWATALVCGTFAYMPPEWHDATKMTYRYAYDRDMYSVGVIIMEILTGKRCCHHDIDMVVESWSDMVEKSHSDVQMEQVRICAEIAIECIDFNAAKRPDTQHIISRLDQIKTMGGYVKTGMITSHQAEDAPTELHLDTPDTPREASSKVRSHLKVHVTSGVKDWRRCYLKAELEEKKDLGGH